MKKVIGIIALCLCVGVVWLTRDFAVWGQDVVQHGRVRSHFQKIELVSPNGEHRIVLEATDGGAAIWVLNRDPNKPSVALYEGFDQDRSVIGAYMSSGVTGMKPSTGVELDSRGELTKSPFSE